MDRTALFSRDLFGFSRTARAVRALPCDPVIAVAGVALAAVDYAVTRGHYVVVSRMEHRGSHACHLLGTVPCERLLCPLASNPDVDPNGRTASFLRSGMARAVLRGRAIPAGVLHDEIPPQIGEVDPRAGRDIEDVLPRFQGMTDGEGNRVLKRTDSASLLVEHRVADVRRSLRGVIEPGVGRDVRTRDNVLVR